MSVLKECQIETAKILAQLVPKKYRKKLVRDLVAEKSPQKLPQIERISELEKLIEA